MSFRSAFGARSPWPLVLVAAALFGVSCTAASACDERIYGSCERSYQRANRPDTPTRDARTHPGQPKRTAHKKPTAPAADADQAATDQAAAPAVPAGAPVVAMTEPPAKPARPVAAMTEPPAKTARPVAKKPDGDRATSSGAAGLPGRTTVAGTTTAPPDAIAQVFSAPPRVATDTG